MPKRKRGTLPGQPAGEHSLWDAVTQEVAQMPPEFVVWDLVPVLGGSVVAYMIGEVGMETERLPERIKNHPELIMRLRLALKLIKLLERVLEHQEVADWFKGGELLLPECPAEQIRNGFSNRLEARLRSLALQLAEPAA